MPREEKPLFVCRLCGQEHEKVELAPGQTARCVRCGTKLARRGRLGPNASIAFALTALAFAAVSAILPLVAVRQLGNTREYLLASGTLILFRSGMTPLAAVVLFCGVVSPALLVGGLLALQLPERWGLAVPVGPLRRLVETVTDWSYPEVQLLAFLVGFVKLADIVTIVALPGLWCYAAMSISTVLAYRTFEFDRVPLQETRVPFALPKNL